MLEVGIVRIMLTKCLNNKIQIKHTLIKKKYIIFEGEKFYVITD